jgi:hypothetical protein
MSTVKSKKLQVGTDATSSNNFTIYQPATPDGTLRIGQGTADSPTEVGRFDSNGYVATNAPAFHVSKGDANQSISNNTTTKVTFNATEFDLTSDWDGTNNRLTPSVEGYYQVNSAIYWSAPVDQKLHQIMIRKNGSTIKFGNISTASGTTNISLNLSTLVYANGTTDYFEIYCYHSNGSSKDIRNLTTTTYFDMHLARAI